MRHLIFIHAAMLSILLCLANIVQAQSDTTSQIKLPKHQKEKKDKKASITNSNNVSSVKIIYDTKTKDFDPIAGQPQYVKEGSSIIVEYRANPFLYKANVSIQNIDINFSDTSIITSLRSQASKLKDTSGVIVQDVNSANLAGNGMGRGVTFEEVYNNNVRQTINDIGSSTEYINELLNLDTVIQMQKNNSQNTDGQTMQKNILEAIANQNILSGKDINIEFNSEIADLENLKEDLYGEIDVLNPLTGTDQLHKDIVNKLNVLANYLDTAYVGNNFGAMRKKITLISQDFNEAVNADYVLTDSIMTAQGDLVQINSSLYNYVTKKNEYPLNFTIKTYGGLRIDFSAGLALTFGNVNGNDYDLRKNPNDSTTGPDTAVVKLFTTNNNRIVQFNPVGFVHFYFTGQHKIPIMCTVGFSPDFTQLGNSIVYLGLGCGFFDTKDHTSRIIFSAGLSAGYTDVLKPKYVGWNNYARFPGLTDDDLTTRSIRTGAFFSISYNLGGFKLY